MVCCSCAKTRTCVRCVCVSSRNPCWDCYPGREGQCANRVPGSHKARFQRSASSSTRTQSASARDGNGDPGDACAPATATGSTARCLRSQAPAVEPSEASEGAGSEDRASVHHGPSVPVVSSDPQVSRSDGVVTHSTI